VQSNYSGAKIYFEKCRLLGIDENVVCQNLAHIAFVQHDETTAKELYKKSYDLFIDKNEFYKSCMDDFKYLQNAGVDKNVFEQFIKGVTEQISE